MGRTAAIWSVPFNTQLRVTHLTAGRNIIVRIYDWYSHKRLGQLIDLSTVSFRALGACGLCRVWVVVVPGAGCRVADAH